MPITDSASLVRRWFDSLRGISAHTLAQIRGKVQQKTGAGACRHLIPQLPVEYRAGAELQACVEQAIEEEWDTITSDERLLIRFPTTRKIGEQVELQKRGVGTVIRRDSRHASGFY